MASEKVEIKVSEARKAVVDTIVKMIEREGLNWFCQWDSSTFMPRNGATGRRYHGGNRLHLMAVAYNKSYSDARWFTFKQARENGFRPRKGEKAAIVEFWKSFKGMKDAHGEWTSDPADAVDTVVFPKLCGYFSVFNAEQLVDGDGNSMEPEEIAVRYVADEELVEIADTLKYSSRCKIIESRGIDQACYSPLADAVKIPSREFFSSLEGFGTVLAHEMSHSTMKPLGRKEASGNVFGSSGYAFEELVAELGSTFVCLELGIHRSSDLEKDENFELHAAYLQSWLKVFKSDHDYLFKAASEADKAAEYILSRYAQVSDVRRAG